MTSRSLGYAGILCIVHGSALIALPCRAQERWSGSLAVTTDYVYRGISQTDGQPAAQVGFQYASGGLSAGAWASNVDLREESDPTYELDLHAAYGWRLGSDWLARLGIVHYEYPDHAGDYDYDEVTASVSFQERVTASIAWSPNTSRYGNGTFVSDRSALAYELALLQPIGPNWSVCAGIGYYDLTDLFDTGYTYWNAGVAFTWHSLQIDLLHIDTDERAQRLFGYRAEGRHWTAALSWRF